MPSLLPRLARRAPAQRASARTRRPTGVVLALATLAGTALVGVTPGTAAAAVPPARPGLTAAIDPLQPYVGQKVCDPVSKPGAIALRDLLIRTYPSSGNLGIVRDCGIGGASEHKEGRAFDWAVSAYNPTHVAQVQAFTNWLTATDRYGNSAAMARRTGVMYMIWNRQIWKAYDASAGWRPYTGPSPHTDHVHISLGWSGANKRTSYWDGTVSGVELGPGVGPQPAPGGTAPRPPAPQPVAPAPVAPKPVAPVAPKPAAPVAPKPVAPVVPPLVTPERTPVNLAVLRAYGRLTLRPGTQGAPVAVVQQRLRVTPADGRYGARTTTAVRALQAAARLPVTGAFGPAEWKALFPAPVVPLGAVSDVRRVPGGLQVSGWALDADTAAPLLVALTAGGTPQIAVRARHDSPDVARSYPGGSTMHGFTTLLQLPEGAHRICATAVNAPGTPGTNSALGCRTATVAHAPVGRLERVTALRGAVRLTGWALDADRDFPVQVRVTVDGRAVGEQLASATRGDVAARYPGYGAAYGLALDVPVPRGEHRVCATALNATGTPGTDALLGCRTVEVDGGKGRGKGKGREKDERDDD